MKFIVMFFIGLKIFTSCSDLKNKQSYDREESSFLNQNIDSLINLALNSGSKKAFDEGAILLSYYEDMERLLWVSTIMADKYNYSNAYFYAYLSLNSGYERNSNIINFGKPFNYTFSKYYLLKAHELENSDNDRIFSINLELKEQFKEYPILPKSEDYLISKTKKKGKI